MAEYYSLAEFMEITKQLDTAIKERDELERLKVSLWNPFKLFAHWDKLNEANRKVNQAKYRYERLWE